MSVSLSVCHICVFAFRVTVSRGDRTDMLGVFICFGVVLSYVFVRQASILSTRAGFLPLVCVIAPKQCILCVVVMNSSHHIQIK